MSFFDVNSKLRNKACFKKANVLTIIEIILKNNGNLFYVVEIL